MINLIHQLFPPEFSRVATVQIFVAFKTPLDRILSANLQLSFILLCLYVLKHMYICMHTHMHKCPHTHTNTHTHVHTRLSDTKNNAITIVTIVEFTILNTITTVGYQFLYTTIIKREAWICQVLCMVLTTDHILCTVDPRLSNHFCTSRFSKTFR